MLAYSKALKGRRDKMYLGYSWYEAEMRTWGTNGPRPPRPASRNRPAGSRRNSRRASTTA